MKSTIKYHDDAEKATEKDNAICEVPTGNLC